MKNIIQGIAVLVIGGVAYTVNQADVIDTFSRETGLSQEEAKQYVENISEEELVAFTELGEGHIEYGTEMLAIASEIDCALYEFDWESASLPCEKGKMQIKQFGDKQIELGNAFITLDSDSATEIDIRNVIHSIDSVNATYSLEIIRYFADPHLIDEETKTNSYNKAILQSALEE